LTKQITTYPISNIGPCAFAGPDQTVNVSTEVILKGTGSWDADHYPYAMSFSWQQISGSEVNINGTDQIQADFVPQLSGMYVFELTVSDGINSDSNEVIVHVLGDPAPSPTPAVITLELQAEDASWDDARVESEHPGYTGSGYVNTSNSTGRWIEWTVDAAAAGSSTCVFRYANGSSGRAMDLSVNGSVVASLGFVSADAWTNWSTEQAVIPLDAGLNAIRLTAATSGGAPNMDKMDITLPGTGPAPTPEPTPSPTPAATPAALITNMIVNDNSNAVDWSIQTNLQVNDKEFGDRNYLITTLPGDYSGSDWIRSACDSKAYTGTTLVSFTVTADSTVFVAHDDRISTKPDWLTSGWIDTGDNIVDNESTPVTLSLYSKNVQANTTVSLGPNGQSSGCIGYFVIVGE
jgi:hypothetical protein